jgi:hypothetical protein
MSTLRTVALVSLASICVASSGCASRHSLVTDPSPTALTSYDANYTETAYRAVQYMLWNARDQIVGDDAFDSTRPVLCAVAVDLNDMNKTTNFGRLMGQSLKTALQAHRSNRIIEVDLRQAYIPIVQGENAGEFLLSRNLLTLAPRFNAGAALVSTYSIALNKVYVTVELINVDQNVIVAAHQFEVPIGPRTWALLTNKELPPEADTILQYRPPQSASGQMDKPWPFANQS